MCFSSTLRMPLWAGTRPEDVPSKEQRLAAGSLFQGRYSPLNIYQGLLWKLGRGWGVGDHIHSFVTSQSQEDYSSESQPGEPSGDTKWPIRLRAALPMAGRHILVGYRKPQSPSSNLSPVASHRVPGMYWVPSGTILHSLPNLPSPSLSLQIPCFWMLRK